MSIMGTSVSGMGADTNWLSAISQNVANANTTGYKEAQTEFEALVDQSGANSYSGAGVTSSVQALNAMQGSIVGGQSSVTDLAVQGAGYFVVSDAAGDLFLTRSGGFVPDSSGNLVNAAGYYLMGYNIQNGPANITANSLNGTEKVNINQAGETATPSTSGTFTANLPSTATAVTTAADLPSANPSAANVQYTDKTSIVAYDNLGGSQTIDLYYTKTGVNASGQDTWEVTAYNHADASASGGFPYSSGPLATETLNFNSTTGALASVTSGGATSANLSLSIPVPNGQSMTLDLSAMSQLAAGYSVSQANVNGNAASSVTGVSIAADGTLSFQYSNGTTVAGYQIPLANVASPNNMTSINGDAFQANGLSGAVKVGTAGSGGFGSIESSSLEGSTVDLATELTQMIQAQSAYEANSKVFQTGANILDVLNNLKS
ncbi:MAG TPA: flagellar hook protein FlgE [Roseiarcus sp.]|nr:flagellar hook protein FlgE [Roseiarcus sp.]